MKGGVRGPVVSFPLRYVPLLLILAICFGIKERILKLVKR